MALVLRSQSAGALGLAAAKQHLRQIDGSKDTEIVDLAAAACEWAERHSNRTLRAEKKWNLSESSWPRCEWILPWPPVLELGDPDDATVKDVAYYDEDNVLQELDADNYHLLLPTDGAGRIVWATDADLPEVYDRPDAVQVNFVTGYATVPLVAVQAMKLKLTEFWGSGDVRELESARHGAAALLAQVDWPRYA